MPITHAITTWHACGVLGHDFLWFRKKVGRFHCSDIEVWSLYTQSHVRNHKGNKPHQATTDSRFIFDLSSTNFEASNNLAIFIDCFTLDCPIYHYALASI
jgi:hypothetical protein